MNSSPLAYYYFMKQCVDQTRLNQSVQKLKVAAYSTEPSPGEEKGQLK